MSTTDDLMNMIPPIFAAGLVGKMAKNTMKLQSFKIKTKHK